MNNGYRIFTVIILILLTGSISASSTTSYEVGMHSSTILSPKRGTNIDFTLWYPAKKDGIVASYGDSNIFQGVASRKNASIIEGTFPLIFISHGGFRSNPTLSDWIASSLAERGNLVIVVHPPKLTDSDAATASNEIWLRPADLSATLDAVINDPNLATHIQPQKVAAIGFFLGGTSVLKLAGLRLDTENYKKLCDEPNTNPDCRWFAKNAVDLNTINDAEFASSNFDPRVNVVVAVNPELSSSMVMSSLKSIQIPFKVINLGKQENIPSGLDASVLEKQLSSQQYLSLPESLPFDAFSLCTIQAIEILREDEEDDTICLESANLPRKESHRQIAQAIDSVLIEAGWYLK